MLGFSPLSYNPLSYLSEAQDLEQEVPETLSLTEQAVGSKIVFRDVSETLTFTEDATGEVPPEPTVKLQFVPEGVFGYGPAEFIPPGWLEAPTDDPVTEVERDGSDTLSFVEDADVSVIRACAASDSLSLSETAVGQSNHQFVSESLTLVESLGRLHTGDVSETLSLVETALCVFTYDASESLSFSEVADSDRIVRVFEVLNALSEQVSRTRITTRALAESFSFAETVLRIIVLALSESLTFTEVARRLKFGSAAEILSLIEDVDADAIKAISEFIEFDESADRDGSIFVRIVAEEVELDEIAAWRMVGGDSACLETYDPGISTRTGLRLTFPYVSPSVTLDLRVPKFGNTHRATRNVKVRRTITGQLRVARSTTWPIIEELNFSFEALTLAQRDALLSFVEQAAGKEIGLLDHEDRQWRGIILSNAVGVVQEGRSDCDYAASFTFRGRVV